MTRAHERPHEALPDHLAGLRLDFGASATRRRKAELRRLAKATTAEAETLKRWHELALFARAFPDDAETLRLADAALRRAARVAAHIVGHGPGRERQRLVDSGIAGTESFARFSMRKLAWLARRFPRDTDIVWEEESAGAGLDTMLEVLIERAEFDGLEAHALSTHAWFDVARGRHGRRARSDLRWIVDHFERLDLAPALRDHLFDLLEIEVRWRLRDPIASRTRARLPGGRRHYQREALRRGEDIPTLLDARLPAARPLPPGAAREVIDIARASLAVRGRETDPVTHANPRDITPFHLERGLSVYLFGFDREHRLPFETYYGFVAAKNGVPIAYGGGWMFMGRCEIGVNVFDSFRGGESQFTFAQLLRVYRHHFRVTRFTVDPYQFGRDNPEAIRSGAFWFYYRFGFRPQDATLAAAAESEWRHIGAGDGHRTPARLLRRFATVPLGLRLPRDPGHDLEPKPLSLAVTRRIGRDFHGEREQALAASVESVQTALGRAAPKRLDALAGRSWAQQCLALALIDDLADWPREDKRALVAAIASKGGLRERDYALRTARHGRLAEAWRAVVAGEARLSGPRRGR